MDSIWTKTVNLPQFPALLGDLKTDVLIIGGGMAGILCAHFLQEQGVDEAECGMSFRNYKDLLLIGGGDKEFADDF